MNKADLIIAVEAALKDDWHIAHNIAQKYGDNTANWLQAVLHKIEGDAFNSRYWYARTQGKTYEDFSDINVELSAIRKSISE